MSQKYQKEAASKFWFPWQVLYSAGGLNLGICLSAFIFEVFTNQEGMWAGFFGLYNQNNKDYIHWMSAFTWILSLYLALQTISMLFRDTTGHYNWRAAIYASEQIHKEAAAMNVGGRIYQIWSYYGNGFPRGVLIASLITDWYGFYTWEGRPIPWTFLGILASVVNIALSIVVNYASTIGTLQSVHMIEEGKMEKNRQKKVYTRIGLIEAPEQAKLQIPASRAYSPEPARPAMTPRGFDIKDAVTGEFRDPSEPARPTQKTQPRPTGAPPQQKNGKVPPIPMEDWVPFVNK